MNMNQELIREADKIKSSKSDRGNYSPKQLKHRKMLLVLPLLIIPFLTLAFWALGGGKDYESNTLDNNTGLNLQLPDAKLKDDKNADKLSFYNQADADSLKRDELLRNDPYYKDSVRNKENTIMSMDANLYDSITPYNRLNNSPYNKTADVNEQKIYQKINELNKQINQPEIASQSYNKPMESLEANENHEQFSNEVDKLEAMMEQMNNKPTVDPEMQQLNSTLERILDIQHPDRVKEKLKEKSLQQKDLVFLVSKHPVNNYISLLDTGKSKLSTEKEFYTIDGENNAEEQNTIEAVVHQTQIIVNGAVVKMRLLNDLYINGALIPKDYFVYGVAQLNNERLEINIHSIRSDNSLFPVKLEVFDMDGLPGIYIPGTITLDVSKQATDNALQSIALNSLDPSIGAQAASAGIETAKTLLSKKVKLVKVQVKGGYKILLKENNQQQ
jgi:conjugative transposon TraM protein